MIFCYIIYKETFLSTEYNNLLASYLSQIINNKKKKTN